MELALKQYPTFGLDRPNPNGTIIDGPILEKEHKEFCWDARNSSFAWHDDW